MKKTEDPKFKALAWYLDFASLDLSSLYGLEFVKVVLEAKDHFLSIHAGSPFDAEEDYAGSLLIFPQYDGKKLYYQETSSKYPWKANLEIIQREMKGILARVSAWSSQVPEPKEWLSTFSSSVSVNMHLGFWEGKTCTIVLHPTNTFDLVACAKANFFHLLSGLPPDVIKKCEAEGCGKFYLHLTKRKRQFCSPRCASKAISKKRRESNRKKYNKKQKKLMESRRDKDVEQRFGKAVAEQRRKRREQRRKKKMQEQRKAKKAQV